MEEEKEYENTFVNTIKRDYGSLPSETPRYSLHLRNPSGSASQLSNTGSQSSVLCHQQSLSRTATKRLNFLTHPESPKKTSVRAELERKIELADLKANLKRLENKYAQLESKYKIDLEVWKEAERSNQKVIQFEKEKLESFRRKNDHLKGELEKARQDSAKSRKELRDVQDEINLLKGQVHEHKRNIEEEKEKYKISMHDVVMGLRCQLQETSQENYELKGQLAEYKHQISSLQKTNGELKEYCYNTMKEEEEKQRLRNENMELKLQVSGLEEKIKLSSIYTEEIGLLPKLKSDIARLEQQNRTFMHGLKEKNILHEKILTLEATLSSTKERLKVIPDLYDTIEKLKRDSEKWQNSLREFIKVDGELQTEHLYEFVEKMKSVEVDFAVRLADLNQRLQDANSEVRLLQHKLQTAEKQTAVKPKIGEDELRKTNKKLNLITKERDMYKKFLDSYEQDMTIRFDSVMTQRVSQLEEILEQYRTDFGDKLTPQASVTEEEIQKFRERIADLEEQLQEKAKEEGIKILKPKYSLVEIARQERAEKIAKIEEENESLKARIKLMEEGKNEDLTQLVGQRVKSASTKEIEALKAQLESSNRVQERLKEAFRTTSSNFRETIRQVFGYKIDSIPPKYYMRSIYSASENDRLLFVMDDNGDIQLMQTEFSEKLGPLMEEYLQKSNSVPMFMGALTSDLFNSQFMEEDTTIMD
ncbi:mitotic spindle assembly checkpoint protein MAD1-like [Artemia franciscana]|uniref:Mitotic spindle assembly checkpoint protein MAD1 n=1 Tax=Artemia franciscana TaxID=6661 RepID=A0AA88HVX0_ARTSF|nr:hypothetical protein QYM36_012839 [Artemia franciscana]